MPEPQADGNWVKCVIVFMFESKMMHDICVVIAVPKWKVDHWGESAVGWGAIDAAEMRVSYRTVRFVERVGG